MADKPADHEASGAMDLQPLSLAQEAADGPSVAYRRALGADELNRKIMERLQEDGRTPFSTIARELGTSEGTVRNRVAQMIEAKVLKIIAVVDPMALGYTAYGMIGLKLSAGADPRAVAKSFADCDEVTYVLFVAGRYDLLVEVVCERQEALRAFLLERCYGNPEIALIEPMVGLQLFKSLLKWGRP